MLFAYFRSAIPWPAVFKRTLHEVNDDHCFDLSAQLAFYFLLALFPALLFLVTLISYIPTENTTDFLLSTIGRVAPVEIVSLLREQLDQIALHNHAGILTIGIIGAVWSSSAAMAAIINALNHAYDIVDWRPWWKRRVLALGLTIGLAIFTLIATLFLLVGPTLAEHIAAWFGLASTTVFIWRLARWPVIVLCVIAAVDLIYKIAPNRKSRWALVTPGAVLATILFVASSFGFRFYLTNVADYAVTYGTIGGIVVTMLWFYVGSLAILIGAEFNSVIEDSWRTVSRTVTEVTAHRARQQRSGRRR